MNTTKNVYTRNFDKLEKLGIIDLITSGKSGVITESGVRGYCKKARYLVDW